MVEVFMAGGKCLICGKFTLWSYNYYSGDLIDTSVVNYEHKTKTTTKYTNIKAHSNYLCAKCGNKVSIFKLIGGIVLFIIGIALFFLFLFPKFSEESLEWRWIISFGFICFCFFWWSGAAIKGYIDAYKNRNSPSKLKDDEGAKRIISIVDKNLKNHHYFTPSEYFRLK
jgi:hypothetical protein